MVLKALGHDIRPDVTKFRTECKYLLIGKVRGAWGSGKEIRGARRTQHRAFRPTHGKQTAYRATFMSANV